MEDKKKTYDPYMLAFIKIFHKHDLYGAEEDEITDLEKSPDPTVERETREIFRPLFEDIQRERLEANEYAGDPIVRLAEKRDFEGIIRLSRRVNLTDDATGIRSFSSSDLDFTVSNGVTFVATTRSGYVIGVSSMLVGHLEGKKCGYEFTTMVSRLFRRKSVATKLFNELVNWARRNGLTHINTRHLSEDGCRFLEAVEQELRNLKFVINKYSTTSIILQKDE
ncbi:MAG: GNAT family N-acetyltransferase [Candidatus Bathyarchaeota archaeon]|nr:GNAT family N-acetyltransferase [Candidatus Bathyarchaeota archaeon]